MNINFQKIQGAGNDFIVYDNRDGSIELSPEQVQQLCDRHFGIGADGIIEVRESPRPECPAYMHYINADGSLAEMCGNGVRCFARFLIENNIISTEELLAQAFVADTLAGPRQLYYEIDEEGSLKTVSVAMGEPVFEPKSIPTTLAPTKQLELDYTVETPEGFEQDVKTGQAVVLAQVFGNDARYAITCVNMGNPHAVVFLEDLDELTARAFVASPESFDLESHGAFVEGNTKLFPEKINAEFAAVSGNNRITMRVYERGCGETLACGTGACAVAVAAVLLGRADRNKPIYVDLPGGTLTIAWLPDNVVGLTGPAETVYSGTIEL